MSQGTRTFAALERVHTGKLQLAGKGKISASLQARVLTALLRYADGNTGEVRKVSLSKIAGEYITSDSVKKACYAMQEQGIVLDLKQTSEKFAMTIHPFVYDESSAPPTARPAKQKKPRDTVKGAMPTSDMRNARGEKGAMPTSVVRNAHGEKGAMPTSHSRGSRDLHVNHEVQRRDQESTRRDLERERLGDPGRDLEGERLRDPERARKENAHPKEEISSSQIPINKIMLTSILEAGDDAKICAFLREYSPESIAGSLTSYQRSVLNGRQGVPRHLWDPDVRAA